MKNQWLKLAKARQNSVWTIEFTDDAVYSLRPRRIILRSDPSLSTDVHVSFQDVSYLSTLDADLFQFLTAIHHHGMNNLLSRIRRYQGMIEKEIFTISGLRYTTWCHTGLSDVDLKYSFQFYSHKAL